METQILTLALEMWHQASLQPLWVEALEAGKVLYFPKLGFETTDQEKALLTPSILAEGTRNISLDDQGHLKGAEGGAAVQGALAGMVSRFRGRAVGLIKNLLPGYADAVRLAPTSYRPVEVQTRTQSWRADDRRLHIDAFPSRPNRGERILRVFANINPDGHPRVWRVGEPFETVAEHFAALAKPYSPLQARALNMLGVTKSLRSEYDHLMLQLHDGMKGDLAYQQRAGQETVPFAAGSVWVCFSDQTSHAVMSGQHMLEQTLHLPVDRQYNPAASPLATLTRLTGHPLV